MVKNQRNSCCHMGCPPMIGDLHFHRRYSLRLQESKPLKNNGIIRKRPEGRRKFLACSDLRVTARQIVLGYRLRWAVEIFHKNVKQHLGFEDVATSGFDSV